MTIDQIILIALLIVTILLNALVVLPFIYAQKGFRPAWKWMGVVISVLAFGVGFALDLGVNNNLVGRLGIGLLVTPLLQFWLIFGLALNRHHVRRCPNCHAIRHNWTERFCIKCGHPLPERKTPMLTGTLQLLRWASWLAIAMIILGVGGLIGFIFAPPRNASTGNIIGGTPTPIPSTEIIIAIQDIPFGQRVAFDAIGVRAWPDAMLPADYLSNLSDVVGKVAQVDLYHDQPILARALADDVFAPQQPAVLPRGFLTFDMKADGVLDNQHWMEVWSMQACEGETAQIEVIGDFAPAITLWDEAAETWIDGTRISDQEYSILRATFATTGFYGVYVTRGQMNSGSQAGPYHIVLKRVNIFDPLLTSGMLLPPTPTPIPNNFSPATVPTLSPTRRRCS